MRKELICMEQVFAENEYGTVLHNFNLLLTEGESLGILVKNEMERDAIIALLTGSLLPEKGGVYTAEALLLRKKVFLLEDDLGLLNDMTVAENIFALKSGRFFHMVNQKAMQLETRDIMEEFALQIDANTKVKMLSKTEKRILEILKAYVQHAKVIILKNILTDYSSKDLKQFHMLQKTLQEKGITFVMLDSRRESLVTVCDRVMVVDSGMALKVFDAAKLRMYVGNLRYRRKDPIEGRERHSQWLFRVEHLSGRFLTDFSLNIEEGEVVSIQRMGKDERTELIHFLLGRPTESKGILYFRDKQLSPQSESAMKANGISFLRMQVPVDDYIFPDMTALQNICIGSISKISNKGILRDKMLNLVGKEFANELEACEISLNLKGNKLTYLQKLQVYFCRLLLEHPKLLICEELFAHEDPDIDTIVLDFLEKTKKAGTAVLLLSSGARDAGRICDRQISF